MNKNQEILSLAVLAGEILIKNGGEIFRVEDTMMRIIESYGIKDYNVYVLSNGIFATIDEQGSHPYSLVRHVAFSNVNLERIAAVNQLSREICEFHYPPGEAIQKMKSCSTLLSEKQLLRHLASGFGCAAFTLLFGGKYLDCFFFSFYWNCPAVLFVPCQNTAVLPLFLYDCRKCSRNGTQHFTLCPACTCHGR